MPEKLNAPESQVQLVVGPDHHGKLFARAG